MTYDCLDYGVFNVGEEKRETLNEHLWLLRVLNIVPVTQTWQIDNFNLFIHVFRIFMDIKMQPIPHFHFVIILQVLDIKVVFFLLDNIALNFPELRYGSF